jgi:hypothetical protein
MKCKVDSCQHEVCIKKNGKPSLFCSTSCRGRYNAASSLDKRKKTNLQKYGVDNPAKSETFKEKTKNTVISKYGVEYASQLPQSRKFGDANPMRNPKFKQNLKNSMIEKYGVSNIYMLEEFKDKRKQTMLEKYGVEHPSQSEVVQNKRREKCIEKHNRTHHGQFHMDDEEYSLIYDIENLKQMNQDLNLTQIANKLKVSKSTIANMFSHNDVLPIRHGNKSSFQDEIMELLKSLGITNIIKNDKSIISKELDIYLPDYKLAIECNGTFFHCERYGNKNKHYHLTKTNLCKEKGVRLIHIFDHKWYSDKTKFESILKAAVNKIDVKYYARKLKLVQVDKKTEKEFFKLNHIQNYKSSNFCLGLVDNENNLVSAMSFGKSRFDKTYDSELLRYANKIGTIVVGGAAKLFKHYLLLHPTEKIVSYCDLSLFTGEVYKNIGFVHTHDSPPSYFYTKNYRTSFNRIKFQKHKLKNILNNFDPNITEWENMKNNKWDRYWDCGNSVWSYHKYNHKEESYET